MDYEVAKYIVSLRLSDKRYKHSVGVAETAARLAKRYGEDENDAKLAGILHDITKEFDDKKQLDIIKTYRIKLDDVEKNAPKLYHAITAPLVLQKCMTIPPHISGAIRYHTTGRANMSLLEKILYIADYIEPNRDFDGVEEVRALAFENLDAALKLALVMSVEEVEGKGGTVHKDTLEAIEFLESLYRMGSSELI